MYAAVVLASAGLSRMGLEKRISQVSTEVQTVIIVGIKVELAGAGLPSSEVA